VLFVLAGANLKLIFDSTIKKIIFFIYFKSPILHLTTPKKWDCKHTTCFCVSPNLFDKI